MALLLVLTGCGRDQELSRGVQLVLHPATLEPTTTFELRFEEAMVASDLVGRTNVPSPLILHPAIRGGFTWLSQRSGVFTPEEPPRLATLYRLSLVSGLKRADGSRSTARLCQFVRTPTLQVIAPRENAPPSGDAPPLPRIELAFNADVRAAEAAPFIYFQCAEAGRVAAEVKQTSTEDFFGYRQSEPWSAIAPSLPLTWQQRFELARQRDATNPPPNLWLEPARGRESPVAHALTVLPVRALPPGEGWELVIEPGLSSPATSARLPGRFVAAVGHVRAFSVRSIQTECGLNSGRKVLIECSKGLAPEITPTNFQDWVTVLPAPTNLTAALTWSSLWLRGDFRLDQRYQIAVRSGLPSIEGDATRRDYSTQLTFNPLPPRLYFPEFSTEQWSEGRREFPLLALNTDRVAVRGKLIDPPALVHALRGYGSYFQRPGLSDEYFSALDYNLLPGRTVFTRELTLSNRVDETERVWLRWDDVLGTEQRGAVLLEAESQLPGPRAPARVGTQALVQLTDLGLVWKCTPTAALVRLFSYATGQGLPNGRIQLRTSENQELGGATTDADGLARLAMSTNAEWLLAELPGDARAAELQRHRLSACSFGLPWEHELFGPPQRQRAFLFSDRPVYRPGDTAHLKALLRAWRDGRLSLPEVRVLQLRGYNARDQQFLETNLTTTAAGSLDYDLVLPRVSQGEYRVELGWDNMVFSHLFLVRDYRPNAFEVRLATAPVYAAGDPVRVGVAAQYLLGQPLSKASLAWSLDFADALFQPEGYEAFSFCGARDREEEGASRSASFQGQGEYSGGTNFVIALDFASLPQRPRPRQASLLVELTDLNQQTLSERAEFLQHSSSYYLGVPCGPDVLRAGDRLPVSVVAVQPDGQPWTNAVVARVRLEHLAWRTVRVESAGRVLGYRYESETTSTNEQEVTTSPLVRAEGQWEVDPAAARTATFTLDEAGRYRLVAEARDPGGREVVTELEFHVAGRDALAWDYRDDARLDLVPDAPQYHVGDTATLLVKAPFSGEALVTVERETVLRSFVTRLEGNAPAIRVPIETNDVPNVFVSVLLLRGAKDNPKRVKEPEYRLGYARLEVEAPETRLNTEVRTDAAEYRPGAPVGVTIEVRDQTEQPVNGAEVTLFAVDEGVLNLTGYETPNPHSHFYAGEPLAVETGLTLPGLLAEDPAQLRYQNKGYLIGGGGRPQPRQNFLACAYWNARLVTDGGGRVRVDFPAPDSLTRYRVMAVAQTAGSQFGHGECGFQVNKPLMLEPALPSFARLGDRLTARAIVLNRTDRRGEVEVVLRLDDQAVLDTREGGVAAGGPSLTNRLPLLPQAAGAVDVPLEFVRAGKAEWTWSARWLDGAGEGSGPGAEATDAVRSTLSVGYPAPLLREIRLAHLSDGETNLWAEVNPQLLEGGGRATLRVSSSRLGELGEAVSQLLHYPYGCVEQTTSSLLPWLVLDDGASTWLRTTNRAEEIRQAIRKGVDRLWAMQTYEGGLAYWPGGREPTLWGSAYGALALALAQRRGLAMNPAAFDTLLKYLKEELQAPLPAGGGAALGDRCLAALALAYAGKPEPSFQEVLFNHRMHISPTARAWLAAALIESDGARDRAEELLRMPPPAMTSAWDAFGCAASEAGVRLLAWVRAHPQAPEVAALVAELSRTMREGHWGSTQGNAWALLALAEYARRVESDPRGASGRVWHGAEAEAFTLADRGRVFEREYDWPAGAALAALRLRTEGAAPLFTQLTVEAQPRVWAQPRQDRGYRIVRTYQRLNDLNAPQLADGLKVGDRVLVTLMLEVRQSAHYLVVDDPLPCVFEAVNPEFRTQATREATAPNQEWVSNHRELRADRAVFFCNQLAPGEYVIRYLARARAAGDVWAPATKAEEMYHPERFGLSDTVRVRVQPN